MQMQYMFSPIEEGLASLALAPKIVVEVQVVPRSMSRVDLQSNTDIMLLLRVANNKKNYTEADT